MPVPADSVLNFSAEEVTRHFHGRWNPDKEAGWIPCPAHNGQDKNCTVRDGHSGLLVICKSRGCDPVDILRAISQGMPNYQSNTPRQPRKAPTPNRDVERARQLWNSLDESTF